MDTAKLQQLVTADTTLLSARDEEGMTPLHLAAISGNTAALSLLLAQCDPATLDTADTSGHTALHWAAVCGQLGCAQLLLGAGADPDTRDPGGGAALHYAAQADHAELVAALLEGGADPGLRDTAGRTPEMWAACAGAEHTFLALGSGDTRDLQSLSPLHCAAALGHHHILAACVERGLYRVNTADSDGAPPLFYAARHGHVACVKELIRLGADLNTRDSLGRTAAMCGVVSGRVAVVRLLAGAGARLDPDTRGGDTCLHLAAARGDAAMVAWLVGACPGLAGAAGREGVTPLHLAADHDSVAVCRLLLEAGCGANPVTRQTRGR